MHISRVKICSQGTYISLCILRAWVMYISNCHDIHESCTYPLIRTVHLSCTSLWMYNIHSWRILSSLGIELTNPKNDVFTKTWTHRTRSHQSLDRLYYYFILHMLQTNIFQRTQIVSYFFLLVIFWPFNVVSDTFLTVLSFEQFLICIS